MTTTTDCQTPNNSLAKKYRPRHISEMVLPACHELNPAFRFLRAPYPSEWLFTGKSGIGKSTLAEIMAQTCANENHVHRLVGSDLDSNRVKDIEASVRHSPLFGGFHFFRVDEADTITSGGQVRLLTLLESAQNCIWVFTSNEGTDHFESRFLSRVHHINFSTHGLLESAVPWLIEIADREGIDLSPDEATKIIRATKNNLRSALREIERRILSSESSLA